MKQWSRMALLVLLVIALAGCGCVAWAAGRTNPAPVQQAADATQEHANLLRISVDPDTASSRVVLPTRTDTSARALVPLAVVLGLGAAGWLCTLLQRQPRYKH